MSLTGKMSFMEGSLSQRDRASLNIVVQGKEEMSRDHIELFTREAIEVKELMIS
jgi:hypothetical protein